MSSFAGQVAVVTGATSGIGAAIAQGLAAGGATVHALGRRAPAAGQRLVEHRIDLADDAELVGFATRLVAETDGLDILVHSAGTFALGEVAETSVTVMDLQWRLNARVPYLLTQLLLPLLVARHGQIAFLNSSIWENARASLAGYAASKYALKALADALRAEVNPAGVRVVSLFPGRTATPMQAQIQVPEGLAYRPEALLQPEDIATILLAALGLPRTAEVTDIHIRPARKGG